MKIMVFLMAIMVLTISCMPCMDKPVSGNDITQSDRSSSENNEEHNESDPCSPFCTCNCCAGFSNQFSSVIAEYLVHASSLKYNAYMHSAPIEISLPVWQPPKLV